LTVRTTSFVHTREECCDVLRPPLPASTLVTIAKRPSIEAGWRILYVISEKKNNNIYVDHPDARHPIERTDKMSFLAQ